MSYEILQRTEIQEIENPMLHPERMLSSNMKASKGRKRNRQFSSFKVATVFYKVTGSEGTLWACGVSPRLAYKSTRKPFGLKLD